jgi:hypothetical protein
LSKKFENPLAGLVGERALDDQRLVGERQLGGPSAETDYGRPVDVVRVRPAEEDLMVIRPSNPHLIDEREFRHNGADLAHLVLVEIRDVPHDQVPAVELDRVPLFKELLQVVVMTDQLVKP